MSLQYMQDVAVPKVIEQEGGVDNILWDTDLDSARADSERIMSAYYRTVVPRIQPVATEERFEMFFPGVEVPIIGYVDVRDARPHPRHEDGQAGITHGEALVAATGQALRPGPSACRSSTTACRRAKTPTIVTALESEDMVVPVPTEAQARNMAHTVKAAADYIEYLLATHGPEEEWPALGAVPDFTRTILPCNFCCWREGCPAWA